MLAKFTSRSNALRLFGISSALIILFYIVIFFVPMPDQQRHSGIYILPLMEYLVNIYRVGCVLLIVSIIWYGIRIRRFDKTGVLVLAAVLLFLPLLLGSNSSPYIPQEHLNTLSTQDHVYQLSQEMFSSCPNTNHFFPCSSRIFLYQCDRSGLMCSLKSPDKLPVQYEKSLNLRLEGNMIEVVADHDNVVYTTPS